MTILRADPTSGAVGAIDSVVVSSESGSISGAFEFNGPGTFGTFQLVYPRVIYYTVDSTLLVRGLAEFSLSAAASDALVVHVPETDARVAQALTASNDAGKLLASNIFQAQTNSISLGEAGKAVFRYDASAVSAKSIAPGSLRVHSLNAQGSFVPFAQQTHDPAGQSISVAVSTPGIYVILGTPAATLAPASGVAGSAFAISGNGFGVFSGTSTRVRFGAGGPLAPVASWSSLAISAVAPDVAPGAYDVRVERQTGAVTATIAMATFTVLSPASSTGPVITLTPFDGQAVASSAPVITASLTSALGADVGTIRLSLDGVDVTSLAVVSASSATYHPSGLADGDHIVTALAVDVGGSTGTAVASFIVDTLAPASTLYINGSAVIGTSTSSLNTQSFSLAAVDRGAGVSDVMLFLDVLPESCDAELYDPDAPAGACANPFYEGPFTLSAGTHTIIYFAYDAADNDEIEHTVAVSVTDDGLPPRTTLTTGEPSASSGTMRYVSDATALGLTTVDDGATVGDATGGAFESFISVDGAPLTAYQGTFVLPEEGVHSVTFRSVDSVGNAEPVSTATIAVDLTAPITTLQYEGAGFTTQSENLIVSTSTLFSLSAGDPITGGAASGLDSTFFVIDRDPFAPDCAGVPVDTSAPSGTCANESYAGPFALSPGTHTIYYLSEDAVGNAEDLAFTLVTMSADALAPRTSLLVGASSSAIGGLFVSSTAVFGVAAQDDLSTADDNAGRIAATYLAVDTTNYALYPGTFTLTGEGVHTISYYSVDWNGQEEVLQTTTAVVDTSAPLTTVDIVGSSAAVAEAGLIISTDSLVSLTAADAGSGIAQTFYSVDGGTQQVYAAAFALAEGTHTVSFASFDLLGNEETARTSSITVQERPYDILPPRTHIAAIGPTFDAGTLYAAGGATFTLTAADDGLLAGDAAGKGVTGTFVAVDSLVYSPYEGEFTIPSEGTHTLTFYSIDAAGHVEGALSTSIAVDLTSPVSVLTTSGPTRSDNQGELIVSTTTRFNLSAQDTLSHGVAAGVNSILYAVDEATAAAYTAPFTLALGTHSIFYYARDNVDNAEGVHVASVSVRDDALPPRTTLLVGESSSTVGGLFANNTAVFGLSAADDLSVLGDGAGEIQATYLAVDSTSYSLYAGTFTLPSEGPHSISFYSVDWTGRAETILSTTAVIDRTSPVTSLGILGFSTQTVQGGLIVSTEALVSLSTADAASGVAETLFVIDDGEPQLYAGPFALAPGTHTVQYRSTDRVGNVEEIGSSFFTVQERPFDVLPPRTSASVGAPLFGIPGRLYATKASNISLTGVDDGLGYGDLAGKGVAQTLYGVDTTTLAAYGGPFTIASEGLHVVRYRSVDATGRFEAMRSTTVAVDFTPPVTTLAAIPSATDEQNALNVLENITPLTLTAQDADSNGAATGLDAILYAVDAGTEAAYAGPFTLAAGPHTLYYRARDRIGNLETVHAVAVISNDVSASADPNPPTAAIVSLVEGSTLTTLSSITGTAADNLVLKEIQLAAQDLETGDWWNGATSNWTASTGPVYGASSIPDLQDVATWSVNVGPDAVGEGFGAFSGFLISSHSYRVYARASDYAGRVSDPPSEASFVWRGATNTFMASGGVLDLVASATGYHTIQANWTAPGESGYTGQAAAYDLRVATFRGKLWQLHAQGFGFNLTKHEDNFQQRQSLNDSLPWGSTSRALGFDADGGAYAFFTIGGAQQQNKPRAVLYNAGPDGVFVSSRPFFYIGGQQSALNQAPGLNLAASVDADGKIWVAGDAAAPGQNAGLWRIDESGLALAGLSPGATASAVLSHAEGRVWMAGTDGELVFWRHDVQSGGMTRYNWTNTLGGTGSAGKAMLETAAGDVWIAGWANGPSAKVAALWRWSAGAIELVATSTGAFGEEAEGLDLDDAGRFWLSGRSLIDGSGTPSLALWTYQTPNGGTTLAEVDRRLDVPPAVDFNAGNALAVAQGKTWALAGPSPYGVRSRSLQLGELTGTAYFADGFTGGNLAFFVSEDAGFDRNVSLFALQPAPPYGTTASYSLTGLAAPATYYLAVVYDLSGTVAAGGDGPGPEDPAGFSYSPSFTPSGGVAVVPAVTLTPDEQAPVLTMLSPVEGSTTTASLLTISGIASDDHIANDLQVGVERLSDGSWWDSQTLAFMASAEPRMDIGTLRTGRADAVSWSVDMLGLRAAIVPGGSYRIHAQVSDLAGHAVSASASVVIISTEIPVISTRTNSQVMSRDAAGNFWVVTQDFPENGPIEFTLRKYDATGFALSSTTLPGATEEGSFGVAFDPSGNAWVGGSGVGPSGTSLAIWKVDAAGEVLLSSASIVSAAGDVFNGGIAVDASGNAWVAGGEATGPNMTFRHGLWKFDTNAALVSVAYFQRAEGALNGTLDAGLATAIDPAGDIWSAGVSSNPVTGRLDLALWKHNASGSLVPGFPVYRPAAFLDIESEGGAEVDMTISPAGAVWIAASQAYPPFQAADANYPIAQGRDIDLDSAGNPFVMGALHPSPNSSLHALWKYSASGVLAAGYPKSSANSGARSLAVDGAGTPWVASEGRPQVFSGTATLAGAAGPGFFATAGFSNLSGTLTYPAGFVAGSTVSLVASRDGFDSDPAFFQLVAPGGPSLPYSVSLLAPATYQILAFVGEDPDNLAPGTPVGVYAHYAQVAVTTSAPVSGVDFAFYIDTTPPVSAFSFVAGSTLTALATIQGTATDDTALIGPMRLAAQDLDNGLWWDASKQDWVVSTGPIYKLISADGTGPLDARRWTVDTRAGSPLSADYSFGGFSDFLPFGHSFALHEKQIDIAGNEQLVPAISSFVWRGANGAFGPPDAVGDLSVFNIHFTSASLNWTAPGEHQNIGQALAYDVRYTTAANFNFSTEFSSYSAAVGLPEPPPAYQNSSFTLTGLLPGKPYHLALKTVNHEGGVSGLSNVRNFSTLTPHVPPRTNLVAGSPSFSTATLYVTDASTIGLVAVDDLLDVGDAIGEGVSATYLALDTTTFSAYAGGAFMLSTEGLHVAYYYSVDIATNVESVSTRTIGVDLTFPVSALEVQGSSITDAQANLIFSTAAAFSMSAQDPVSQGVASGIDAILFTIDDGPDQAYEAPFQLTPGTHTIRFSALDRVAHQEAVHTATFTIQNEPFDILPPRTSLVAGPPSHATTTFYVTNLSSLGFATADDGLIVGDGAGQGAARTYVSVDTAPFTLFSATFSLVVEGTHTLSFYSEDLLGRVEAVSSSTVAVDLTLPVSLLEVAGSSVADATGRLFYSTDTVLSLSASDTESNGVASGIGAILYAVDGASESVYATPFTLSAGTHTIAYRAEDRVANAEAVRIATFTVQEQPFDVLPPRMQLIAGVPSFTSTTVYVTEATPLALEAVDDAVSVGDEAGRGVARSFVAVGTSAFTVYAGTFSLPGEGEHALSYYAEDLLGRIGEVASTTVAIDRTAPASFLELAGSSVTDAQGRLIVSTAATLTLTAEDPISGGVASGIGEILYAVDAATPAAYGAPFTLSPGTHTLYYGAVDNVANAETVRVATFTVQEEPFDVLPPRTTLAAGFPSFSSATLFTAAATELAFNAADDGLVAGDGAGKGVARTFASVDAAPYALYAGTFSVSGEGLHELSFYSEDILGHAEAPSARTVGLDLTAPVSRLEVLGSSVTDTQGRILISTETPIALAASDAPSGGAASGAADMFYAVDDGTEAAYGAPFTLAAGTHTLYYRAQDRVANFENLRSASFLAVAQDSTTAPSRVLSLSASSTGYYAMRVTWTAPGEIGDFGQALAYELRVATFPINTANFASATQLATDPPQAFGAPETAAFNAAEPGRFYYFALKTINHSGQVSPLSNVALTYSGNFFTALDPDGRLWQLETNQNNFNLTRRLSATDQSGHINDYLPWESTSRALGFDADGGAYAFLTIGGAQQQDKPRAVLYEASPSGVFLSSRPFFYIGGQQSALNQAPGLNLTASVDVDGKIWIAGDAGAPGQTAGLWKIDETGLSVAGLSPAATAQAVLALGGGPVWMAGTDGELVFWRHDPASGAMTRYNWTNTLGGAGSGGRAMVETVSGSVWIGGWANGAGGRKAALWRWTNGVIELVATSTGAYSDEALGLDLDASGRFWLSGRAQVDGAGSVGHAFWTYASDGGGSELALAGLDAGAPARLDFGVGNALSLARGQAWGLAGPAPFGTRSRTLGFGELTGAVSYAPGFTGGKVAFFTSPTVDFDSEVSLFALIDAPASGTSFDYTLLDLPAPATYYVAAIYDLSGVLTAGGEEPGPGDPLGTALTAAFLPFGGTAAVAPIEMTPDVTAPTLALLSPVEGSTTTASLFAISGTAADEHLVTDLQIGLQSLPDGLWWDPQTFTFVASGQPLLTTRAARAGPANDFAWSVDMLSLRQAIVAGKSYRIHAQVSDLAGHIVSASASAVIISTEIPVISTRTNSQVMSRDAAGNFWIVTQDFPENGPIEFTLRKYDATGFALSSTTLPGATEEGSFGVAFDPSGNAWVGGSGVGPSGASLAVWKVDAAGAVLLSSTSIANINGDVFNGGIAVDAAGNAWVAGGEATGPGMTFRHGLWKFDASAALVAVTYFQRAEGALNGTLDAGLATAIDSAGDIWSAGVSSNPVTGRLDLALWKYNASGSLLSGFPVYRPAAFLDIESEGGAEVDMTISPAGAVWIAASQAYPPFQAADLAPQVQRELRRPLARRRRRRHDLGRERGPPSGLQRHRHPRRRRRSRLLRHGRFLESVRNPFLPRRIRLWLHDHLRRLPRRL
ncbi:MAG: fibronectin type III domain-containing protein [Elusimicrobia bacterium]|nr:fibronectin type III domain-containing protein [Elusimicrobiota bacterium]